MNGAIPVLEETGAGRMEETTMAKKYYLTTPLYYVNSPLTVGGAYTTVVADVVARYQRLSGKEVFFLTGSDEHGQKMEQAAAAKNLSPRELADQVVTTFLELWELLGISHDDFIRTTERRHEMVVTEAFTRLREKGDIYWGAYEGWYCTPCETFLLESQLTDGNCPQCGRPVQKLVEENYFFRLSRYQPMLEEHFRRHPDFVRPASRFREMLNRLERGLNDVSVTRSVRWGIPVPDRPGQTVWVWFDALLNYISALDPFSSESKFSEIWPADLHLMAKDILWFHAILWPALLFALELPPPRQVFAHGWWTIAGEKISKSKTGRVYAREIVRNYGTDALRYFLLREIPLGLDGDFSESALAARYRSDLAHDLGNLIQRSLSMIKKYRAGRLPARGGGGEGESLLSKIGEFWPRYHQLMEELQLSQVLESLWSLVREANRYIEESKPWRLAKDRGEAGRLDGVLFTLAAVIIHTGIMLEPFLPRAAVEIIRQVQPDLAGRPSFSEAASHPADVVKGGRGIGEIRPLFPLKENGE